MQKMGESWHRDKKVLRVTHVNTTCYTLVHFRKWVPTTSLDVKEVLRVTHVDVAYCHITLSITNKSAMPVIYVNKIYYARPNI